MNEFDVLTQSQVTQNIQGDEEAHSLRGHGKQQK